MSRRLPKKQQRRKCPDFRKPNVGQETPVLKPPKQKSAATRRPRDKKGIPLLPENESLSKIFGIEEESSFDEIYDQTLGDPEIQKVLQETLDNRDSSPRKIPQREFKHYPASGAELDLHGATGPEAREMTINFINSGLHNRFKTLRIITGKGLHSKGLAVLPDLVEQIVIDLKKKGLIQAYRWDKKEKHKSGAIIILIN